MVLTFEDDKKIVLALAMGRALTAAAKQQIHDNNSQPQRFQGAPTNYREPQQNRAARDGFYTTEAEELLDWAHRVEDEAGDDCLVRLILDGQLMVVGLKDDEDVNAAKGDKLPVLRWSRHASNETVDPE